MQSVMDGKANAKTAWIFTANQSDEVMLEFNVRESAFGLQPH